MNQDNAEMESQESGTDEVISSIDLEDDANVSFATPLKPKRKRSRPLEASTPLRRSSRTPSPKQLNEDFVYDTIGSPSSFQSATPSDKEGAVSRPKRGRNSAVYNYGSNAESSSDDDNDATPRRTTRSSTPASTTESPKANISVFELYVLPTSPSFNAYILNFRF